MAKAETFKFPPLREVAFEANFDSKLKIEKEIALFQELISENLPDYSEGYAVSQLLEGLGSKATAKHFIFEDKAKNVMLRCSSSNLNYIVKTYDNFPAYLKMAKHYCEQFCKTYGISRFNRVGLRYINNIEISAPNGVYDFTQYVKSDVTLDGQKLKELLTCLAEIRFSKGMQKLTKRSGLVGEETKTEGKAPIRIYVLDLDGYVDTVSVVSDLEENLNALHNLIEKEFLESLTERFLKYMRSGTL